MSPRKFFSLLALLSLVLVLVACSPAATPAVEVTEAPATEPAPTGEGGNAIVLGDISDDPSEVIEGTQPLADYLAARLGDYGITTGEVRVATSAEQMAEMLRNGEVDLYFDSAYPAMLMADASGAQPFLRRWSRGVGEYHSVIFTTRDSGIESIEDLTGKMIAMDNQYSTSGYVLPGAYLTEAGLTLVGKENYDEPVGAEEIGFVFSFDDENTLQWVLNGLVDAGVTDNGRYASFPDEAKENLVILAETESVPRQMALAASDIDPELLAAIKEILLGADEDEEGMAALESFAGTAKFDEFPEGIDAAIERMRELQAIIADVPLP
jgi:phosphonate transport system substrate-binding protein